MDKRVVRMLAEKPNMDYAGSNVNLVITSSYMVLSVMESGEVCHFYTVVHLLMLNYFFSH